MPSFPQRRVAAIKLERRPGSNCNRWPRCIGIRSSGEYAGVDLHAGLVCIHGPPEGFAKAEQLEAFAVALDQIEQHEPARAIWLAQGYLRCATPLPNAPSPRMEVDERGALQDRFLFGRRWLGDHGDLPRDGQHPGPVVAPLWLLSLIVEPLDFSAAVMLPTTTLSVTPNPSKS